MFILNTRGKQVPSRHIDLRDKRKNLCRRQFRSTLSVTDKNRTSCFFPVFFLYETLGEKIINIKLAGTSFKIESGSTNRFNRV